MVVSKKTLRKQSKGSRRPAASGCGISWRKCLTNCGVLRNRRGQAAIETGLALPFFIFLLYYTINAFHAMHTSHVGQKYAAMNMYQRLNHRAQFAVDDVANQIISKQYIAVQYTDAEGEVPKRRILLDPVVPTRILNVVGICREPDCK